MVAVKKLFDGAKIFVRIKGLLILWKGVTLNWKQALEVYHRLENSEFVMAENSQRQKEGEDTEDYLRDDSMISLESQESSRKKEDHSLRRCWIKLQIVNCSPWRW